MTREEVIKELREWMNKDGYTYRGDQIYDYDSEDILDFLEGKCNGGMFLFKPEETE